MDRTAYLRLWTRRDSHMREGARSGRRHPRAVPIDRCRPAGGDRPDEGNAGEV